MLGIFHRLLAFKCFFGVVPVSAGHPLAGRKKGLYFRICIR